MKILITGSKGQLGTQITNIINAKESELGKINTVYNDALVKGIDLDELDVADLNDVRRIILDFAPNLVINCAAYTNVDGCEANEDVAFKANAIGPRNLAMACEEIGAKLVHISTDYIFAGRGDKPYREYDLANPINVYGKTKLLGERYVQQQCRKYFIVRTAWLYGLSGNNFVKTILKAANANSSLNVVNDQRGNPTNAEDLAYHILKLALTEEYGIYHCTGSGECSWYDFACKIIEYSKLDCTVKPVTTDEYKKIAMRPAFSSLDNMMLRCTIGDEMRPWQEALKMFINNLSK
ncbi:dTDP-4-dehydrorhamnose reductase [Candidatus Clostridium radicumherbarum]|uniref:dTDP-4-dehydrorhamnose reductase n=1 Tax=Candidatus Clostridium radicumherbarum TaxID=3381662 RepID=A0ABW8TTC3_9CLOT